MVVYAKPPLRKKEEEEWLTGESDKIEFIASRL